jgi:hypothetical protein
LGLTHDTTGDCIAAHRCLDQSCAYQFGVEFRKLDGSVECLCLSDLPQTLLNQIELSLYHTSDSFAKINIVSASLHRRFNERGSNQPDASEITSTQAQPGYARDRH